MERSRRADKPTYGVCLQRCCRSRALPRSFPHSVCSCRRPPRSAPIRELQGSAPAVFLKAPQPVQLVTSPSYGCWPAFLSPGTALVPASDHNPARFQPSCRAERTTGSQSRCRCRGCERCVLFRTLSRETSDGSLERASEALRGGPPLRGYTYLLPGHCVEAKSFPALGARKWLWPRQNDSRLDVSFSVFGF